MIPRNKWIIVAASAVLAGLAAAYLAGLSYCVSAHGLGYFGVNRGVAPTPVPRFLRVPYNPALFAVARYYKWRGNPCDCGELPLDIKILDGLLFVDAWMRLTNAQVAALTDQLARIPQGMRETDVLARLPELTGLCWGYVYPVTQGHDSGTHVAFDQENEEKPEAVWRTTQEDRLREEWLATVKAYPFLSKVEFNANLFVAEYELNRTHRLYIVTTRHVSGEKRFVAGFVNRAE